jgi:hypothetical protein
MSLRDAVAADWKLWPEREDVTLRSRSTGITSYTDHALSYAPGGAVKRRAISFRELAASAGVYTSSDRAWLIPSQVLPAGVVPRPGDVVRDGDGADWVVGEVTVGKFGLTHRCVCRNLALTNGLTSSGVLARPASAADAAGRPAFAGYSTVATVACRVQLEPSGSDDVFDKRMSPNTYSAYLAAPVAVKAHDRFTADGVAYTVLGFDAPQRIWDLMRLRLELIPD